MAKVTPKYLPGWKGSLLLDGDPFSITGWTATDTVDSNDVTVDTDNGWTTTEAGCRSVSITFSIPGKAADTASPLDPGSIYPCTFKINNVTKYDGPFLITSGTVNTPVRGVNTYDYTAVNYGDVTPTPPTP